MAADIIRRVAARVAAAVASSSPAETATHRLRLCLHADERARLQDATKRPPVETVG